MLKGEIYMFGPLLSNNPNTAVKYEYGMLLATCLSPFAAWTALFVLNVK